MERTDSFQTSWEEYWSETAGVANEGRQDSGSIWDVAPERAAGQDIERFQRWMNPELRRPREQDVSGQLPFGFGRSSPGSD